MTNGIDALMKTDRLLEDASTTVKKMRVVKLIVSINSKTDKPNVHVR